MVNPNFLRARISKRKFCTKHILMRIISEHIMKVAILSVAFVGFAASPAKAQTVATTASPVQQVIQFMHERKQAYERSDPLAWGQHVAEQCTFIQVGRVLSKAQFIAEMAPFVGYTFSGIVDDVRAAEFGDTIILTYREKEIRDYGVQRTENSYIDTETYIRLDGKWQLILWTENSLPVEPPIVKLDLQTYNKYVGRYEVNPKATFTVTREGNRLMGQYAGEEKFELLPASKSNFFTHGDNAVYVFVWDRSGRVVGHIYRAEGVELRYKKR
jgi:Domain of unknown function (DUF3471)